MLSCLDFFLKEIDTQSKINDHVKHLIKIDFAVLNFTLKLQQKLNLPLDVLEIFVL